MKHSSTPILVAVAVTTMFVLIFLAGGGRSGGDNSRGRDTGGYKCSTCINGCTENNNGILGFLSNFSLESYQIALIVAFIVLVLLGCLLYHTLPCPDEDENDGRYFQNVAQNHEEICQNELEALKKW